jgi:hypothetical protein
MQLFDEFERSQHTRDRDMLEEFLVKHQPENASGGSSGELSSVRQPTVADHRMSIGIPCHISAIAKAWCWLRRRPFPS